MQLGGGSVYGASSQQRQPISSAIVPLEGSSVIVVPSEVPSSAAIVPLEVASTSVVVPSEVPSSSVIVPSKVPSNSEVPLVNTSNIVLSSFNRRLMLRFSIAIEVENEDTKDADSKKER